MKTRAHSLAAALFALALPFLAGSCANQKKKGMKDTEVSATQENARPQGPWNAVDGNRLPTSVGTKDSYSKVNTSMPFVALTFDDGPHATNTPRLLDILKSRNVKATFYVVATNTRRYPEIMRRIVAEGHEIGNHTVTHGNLTKMSESEVRKELSASHEAIVAATGVAPRTMRPPYGAITSSQKSWIRREFGYPSILWSVDPEDWKKPGASIVANRLVSGARPGGILLVHDIHSASIDAMPSAIDQLLAKGFQFVTVTQLIAMDGKG
ncbi:MAG: polysaccharide deacetylase family protein [Verrucomicrobiales bacterium]|nr:polysaccharide deacetylase family protein [Verrucomicrobiales bacterium]